MWPYKTDFYKHYSCRLNRTFLLCLHMALQSAYENDLNQVWYFSFFAIPCFLCVVDV